mgnify:CR=1 FL=1
MQVAAAVGIPIEPASLGVRLLFAHDLASTSARLPTKPLHGKAAQPMVSRGRGLPAAGNSFQKRRVSSPAPVTMV